jgi:peptidoglycan/LPS O-acetylase OafA/YrhL
VSKLGGSRIAGLDGIRGLAVLAVVAFHAGLPVRYGGIVGVTVFFALSGYLITDRLYAERSETGRINLSKFYMRRVLRLVPALVAAVLVTSLFAVATRDPQLDGNYWWQAFAALTYTMDFFGAAGADMPVWGHTWSLAVEEQFYLVWPFLLLAALALCRSRRYAAIAVGTLAVLALGWRVWLTAALGFDGFARVYYAPDTVSYAMLFGCALALGPKLAPKVPTWAGYLGIVLLVCLACIPGTDFNGSDRVVSLHVGSAAGLAVIPVLAAAPRMRALDVRLLAFFGTISYGWYLWHQVFLHMHPFGHVAVPVVVKVPLVIVALLTAWASFRWLEQPLQKRFRGRFEPRTRTVPVLGPRHMAQGTLTP